MEFEDQDDPDEEMGLPVSASYDSLPRTKTSTSPAAAAAAAEASHHRRPARYRECLKNHAVSIGGYAVDGCGEFMPAGDEGSLDALKCAACGCHRNFHRKELEGGGGGPGEMGGFQHHFPHHPFSTPYYRAPAGYIVAAPPHYRPPTPLALPSTSGGGAHSREDQDDVSNNPSSSGGGGVGGGGMATAAAAAATRKRFRTKFTPEQKEKMREFAEKLGWRIQKHDEAAVQQFCNDACVKRHVLKVWMHNNKHTLGKKP